MADISYIELKLATNDKLVNEEEFIIGNLDDWLAVKSDKSKIKVELINIVSLSVELEKIIIVTREHNRLATDDKNTKQWYGIYTLEQLYLVHQHICQIDPSLDKFYPIELKPIKGYLSTYFSNDLTKSINPTNEDSALIDLQDNYLCNSISNYLKYASESLGVNLYIDILFNDLNSSDYFEVYSDFNLKRLQVEIEILKQELLNLYKKHNLVLSNSNNDKNRKNFNNKNGVISQDEEERKQENLSEFRRKLRCIFETYVKEDKLFNSIIKLYAEYYNNLLKPLIDSRELANSNLIKYEKKLTNQLKTCKYLTGQSSIDALSQLKEVVSKLKSEIFDLSNDIDQLCIEYKQNLIDIFLNIIENIKNDQRKFSLPTNNTFGIFFNYIIKDRIERMEYDFMEKKVQMLNLKLKFQERNRDYEIDRKLNKKDSDKSKLKEIQMKIIKIKLEIYSEEENEFKKKLLKLKSDESNFSIDHRIIQLSKDLGSEFFKEIKMKYNIDMDMDMINDEKFEETIEEIIEEKKEIFFDSDDESNFFDTFETPESILEEENKEKNLKQIEINKIKKKILDISSKKSSLRLSLSKLVECEQESQESQIETHSIIKTILAKKEEDKIQKELYIENRNKALQRLKEYKLKQSKMTIFSSTDSLAKTKSNLSKQATKKTYVPKSKQRILPPNSNQTKNKLNHNTKEITYEINLNEFKSNENPILNNFTNEIFPSLSPTPQLPASLLSEPLNTTNVLPLPPPPPPPPLPSLMNVTNASQTSLLPPPPPAPPLPSLMNATNASKTSPPPLSPNLTTLLHQKLSNLTESKTKSRSQEVNIKERSGRIEFDLNEIKNFKFKKSSSKSKLQNSKVIQTNQFNSWDSLMNEIRTNAGKNLRNVNTNSKETSDFLRNKLKKFDIPPTSSSKLEWDLNLILSQRSKFFSNNDDDDDSSSESSWNGSNES